MRRYILTLCALMTALSLTAQEVVPRIVNSNDFRGRLEGAFEWEVVDDLSLKASLEMRLKNDLSTIDRLQTGIGLEYEACKHFNLGVDYLLINTHEIGRWERPRHRANLNLEGKIKVGRFEFALRERVQTTFRTDSVNRYEKMNPELILRSRLSAEYNIRHSRWTPYLLFELHNTLNSPAVVANYKRDPYSVDNYITRYRAGAGAKFKVSRNHRLDFFYYFDYDRKYNIDYKGNKGDLKGLAQENECRHIFGISYKFKL